MASDVQTRQASADDETGRQAATGDAPAAAAMPARAPVSASPWRDSSADGRRLGLALALLLLLVSAGLRLPGLSHPDREYFDEVYYAQDAADYLVRGVECGRAVHPMLGKWLIAGGMAALGDAPEVPPGADGSDEWCDREGVGVPSPASWRIASAVAGTLTVLLLYLAGVRLFRRRGVAALAALLLAVDGVALTSSRISMLDAFLGLFVVAAFWLLLVDRDRQWSIEPGAATAAASPLLARARVAAGVALGLAVATKWSALLAIGAAGLLVLGSELLWRRSAGVVRVGWWRPLASSVLALIVVPAAVYVASYASWFASYENTQPAVERCGADAECSVALPVIVGDWWGEQVDNYVFHRDLEAEHQYRALATTWPVLSRPVAYFYESCTEDRAEDEGPCVVAEGDVQEILGIGNPGVWWVALVVGYPLVAYGMWRRDWRAWVIAVFLLGQYLPWLIAPRPLFLFYTVPLVPFVALASTYGAALLARRRGWRWVPGVVGGLAVAGLWFWWPILVGDTLSTGAWRLRIFFDSWI